VGYGYNSTGSDTMYSGLAMESSTTFEPVHLPPPPPPLRPWEWETAVANNRQCKETTMATITFEQVQHLNCDAMYGKIKPLKYLLTYYTPHTHKKKGTRAFIHSFIEVCLLSLARSFVLCSLFIL
jgi:hypothetical protein